MNRVLRRQRAVLALFIAMTVTGVGVALADSQSGDQPTRTLDLSPHPPYVGTTNVQVTGAGFSSNNVGVTGTVYQAADLPDGTTAIGLTQTPFTSNTSGAFMATISVSPTFAASGSGGDNFQVDCNAANVDCFVEATAGGLGFQSRHAISFSTGGSTTTTVTIPPTTTTVPATTTTVPATTTTVPATTTTVPATTTTVPATTTTVPATTTTVPATTTTMPPTTTTVPGTTTTIGGPTTTLGATQCAQIRQARTSLNAQIDAAILQVNNSSLSPQQKASSIAQLEAIRAQGNAQLDALLVGCPPAP